KHRHRTCCQTGLPRLLHDRVYEFKATGRGGHQTSALVRVLSCYESIGRGSSSFLSTCLFCQRVVNRQLRGLSLGFESLNVGRGLWGILSGEFLFNGAPEIEGEPLAPFGA